MLAALPLSSKLPPCCCRPTTLTLARVTPSLPSTWRKERGPCRGATEEGRRRRMKRRGGEEGGAAYRRLKERVTDRRVIVWIDAAWHLSSGFTVNWGAGAARSLLTSAKESTLAQTLEKHKAKEQRLCQCGQLASRRLHGCSTSLRDIITKHVKAGGASGSEAGQSWENLPAPWAQTGKHFYGWRTFLTYFY